MITKNIDTYKTIRKFRKSNHNHIYTHIVLNTIFNVIKNFCKGSMGIS